MFVSERFINQAQKRKINAKKKEYSVCTKNKETCCKHATLFNSLGSIVVSLQLLLCYMVQIHTSHIQSVQSKRRYKKKNLLKTSKEVKLIRKSEREKE